MMSLVEYASSDSGNDSDPGFAEEDLTQDRYSKPSNSSKNEASKPVIITLPSLSEFDDVDDEPSRKKCKASTGTGLFSMLPPPKNTVIKVMNRSLVPHSVAKNQSAAFKPPPALAAAANRNSSVDDELDSSSEHELSRDGDADEAGSSVDFFSLDNVDKDTRLSSHCGATTADADSSEDPELPISTVDEDVSTTTATVDSPDGNDPEDAPLQFDAAWVSSSNLQEQASSSTDRQGHCRQSFCNADETEDDGTSSSSSNVFDPAAMFNDEGFLRMVGKSRHKREDIQIVDVAQDDQIPKYDEWLTKALTEEVGNRPSRKKGFMPTSQQRRKHQITYLAFQAREREVELKNQWAENRLSRRQTQSKYGF